MVDRWTMNGGVVLHGAHLLRIWSNTQPRVALPSADSELHAVANIAVDALSSIGVPGYGCPCLFARLRVCVSVFVGGHASARMCVRAQLACWPHSNFHAVAHWGCAHVRARARGGPPACPRGRAARPAGRHGVRLLVGGSGHGDLRPAP